MRTCLAFAIVCALGASFAERIPSDGSAPSGDVGVAPSAAVDSAAWITLPGCADSAPAYAKFRVAFAATDDPVEFDVTADERYVLVLDGRIVGRGPDCAPVEDWKSAAYRFHVTPGDHVLEAVVWRQGDAAPLAHQSWRLAFALKARGAYDAALTTGKGAWRVGRLVGTVPVGKGGGTFGTGDAFRVSGAGLVGEEPAAWMEPQTVRETIKEKHHFGYRLDGWLVSPSVLPEQLSRIVRPGRFVGDRAPAHAPFTVAPGERLSFLWDLGDYFCAYPVLRVRRGRGAKVRWGWTESLRDGEGLKGDRREWRGKRFEGVVDEFVCDGRDSAEFSVPWWRCGRWCEISVEGGEEPLEITALELDETRYPLEDCSRFECDDPSVADVRRICARAVQMCSHEMFFDCPYYEQQMYGGDARVEALAMTAMSSDDRLVRRALELFDASRRTGGMMAMNFPSRVKQESSVYTLCALLMYRDYLRWHSDTGFLRRFLPGIRHAVSGFERYSGADGLLAGLPGWNYLDWTPEWRLGRPKGDMGGPDSFTNLLYALALRAVAEVERAVGESRFADVWDERAARVCEAVFRRFWREEAGMLAFSGESEVFCEQVQALAILSDALPGESSDRAFARLAAGDVPARASQYFRHYVFEAYFRRGRGDLFLRDLDEWRETVRVGGSCTFEKGLEFRSDCHAWSAHPIFWLQAGLAGVRPASNAFASVEIRPAPGNLRRISSSLPHPLGAVEAEMEFDESGGVRARVRSPVPGTFVWRGRTASVAPGETTFVEMKGERQ